MGQRFSAPTEASNSRFCSEIRPRLLPQRTHWWCDRRRSAVCPFFRARLAECGALGGGSADRARDPKPLEPTMTTIEARIATQAKRATASAAGKTGKAGSKAKGLRRPQQSRDQRGIPHGAGHETRSHSDTAEPTRRRDHPGNDGDLRLATAQRAWLPGGDCEEEAWLHAHLVEDGGRPAPLPHRNQARSLT